MSNRIAGSDRNAIYRPPSNPTSLMYAIGDIHGRHDLLQNLLALIKKDMLTLKNREIDKVSIVFLGDYIDRGHTSKEVLETLSTLKLGPAELVFLKGNHEAAVLDFIANPESGASWVKFGGRETLSSYNVKIPGILGPKFDWDDCRQRFCKRLPKHHLTFLNGLKSYQIIDEYMFVHAGIDPKKPVASQSDDEFLWIRTPFLESMIKLPYIVVHGHTPEPKPVWDGRRIGLDTGAYLSNKLTSARILDGDIKFLST